MRADDDPEEMRADDDPEGIIAVFVVMAVIIAIAWKTVS